MTLQAVVLALASAVRPSTSLAALYALLSRPAPRPLVASFIASGVTVSSAIGVLVVAGLHGVSLPGRRSTFTDVVDVVAGVACLGFAAGVCARGLRRVRPRSGSEKPTWATRMLRRPSRRMAAAAGVATHVPGLFYLVALNGIAAARPGLGEAVVDVVVYNAIWFSIPLVALIFVHRRPDDAQDVAERANRFMHRHQVTLPAAVFALVGAYLLAKGLAGYLP